MRHEGLDPRLVGQAGMCVRRHCGMIIPRCFHALNVPTTRLRCRRVSKLRLHVVSREPSVDSKRQVRRMSPHHPTLISRGLAACALAAAALVAAGCGTQAKREAATAPATVQDLGPVLMVPGNSALPREWHRGTVLQVDLLGVANDASPAVKRLAALAQQMDEFKAQGVRALLLSMPMPHTGQGAAAAVTNHRGVDPSLGTVDDFDALLREAHARGIGVMMDYVLNHASVQHPIFQQASDDARSAYREWFVWSPRLPADWRVDGQNPWHSAEVSGGSGARPARGHHYGAFGPGTADFNFRQAKVRAFHADNLRFWLNRGVDGVRFLGVEYLVERGPREWFDLPQSRDVAGDLADVVRSYPNRHVLCDAKAAPEAWADATICGGALSQEQAALHVRAARGDAAALRGLSDPAKHRLQALGVAFTTSGSRETRLWQQVEGDAAAYVLASATALLMPATPYLWHDDEPGTKREGQPAEELRTPAVMQRRDLMQLRQSRPSLERGGFEQAFVRGSVMGFQRGVDGERTLVVVNTGRTRAEVDVSGLTRRARLAPIFPRRAGSSYVAEVMLTDASGRISVTVPPRSVRVFDVEQRQR